MVLNKYVSWLLPANLTKVKPDDFNFHDIGEHIFRNIPFPRVKSPFIGSHLTDPVRHQQIVKPLTV